MSRPTQALLVATLMIAACRTPPVDGADAIAAACNEPAQTASGMNLPSVEELWADVQALESPEKAYRFTSHYDATSEADAMRLAQWWRAQDSLEVTVESILPSTPGEVEAILAAGAAGVQIGCDTAWSVKIVTQPAVLTHERTAAWSMMLQSVPQDSAWQLAGLSIGDP